MIVYVKNHCMFSKKVLKAIDALDIDIVVKNKEDEGVVDELLGVGGKRQFPCLVDDEGKALYESDDIVKFLCEKYSADPSHFNDDTPHVCQV